MKLLKQRGVATISITLAMSIGIAILGGVTSFYKIKEDTNEKMNTTNIRVSVLENKMTNILESQKKTESSVEEIRNYLMGKRVEEKLPVNN